MTIYGRNLKRSQGYLLKNTLFNRGFEMHVPYWKKRIIPVQKIAQMCGFASSSQFSRIFKEEMGYSPKFYHGE